MKNKLIFSLIIFIVGLLSVVFVNSYVQALSKQEILEVNCRQNENCVQNNNCRQNENCPQNNNCEQNQNCQMYKYDNKSINQNNECLQKKYNCRRNCTKQMYNR